MMIRAELRRLKPGDARVWMIWPVITWSDVSADQVAAEKVHQLSSLYPQPTC